MNRKDAVQWVGQTKTNIVKGTNIDKGHVGE